MIRSLNVTPKHLIVCSDKSEAEVINNRRLCSTYCTIEANCWQTRSIERPLQSYLFISCVGMGHYSVCCLSVCLSVSDASPSKLLNRFGWNFAEGWRSVLTLHLAFWWRLSLGSRAESRKCTIGRYVSALNWATCLIFSANRYSVGTHGIAAITKFAYCTHLWCEGICKLTIRWKVWR